MNTSQDSQPSAPAPAPAGRREERSLAGRVLLLGSNDRATLVAARSLGRAGLTVEVARLGDGGCGEWSRFVRRRHDQGHPVRDGEASLRRLRDLLAAQPYDLVFPLHDPACELVMADRAGIEALAPVALPPAGVYAHAHDKGLLLDVARRCELPVPETLDLDGPAALDELPEDLPLPVYAKPRSSAAWRDGRIEVHGVRPLDSRRGVIEFCRSHLPRVPVLLQQPVPGRGIGLYLLAREGKILSLLQQERLHEPRGGGGSSYRHTVPTHPALAAAAAKLIEAIGWTGPAMLEVKGFPDSTNGDPSATPSWAVMELNGRLWGSVALTMAAGHDLPLWTYRLFTEPDFEPPRVAPRLGIRARHLRKDLGWLVDRLARGPARGRVLAGLGRELVGVVDGKERLDVESFRDPLPALVDWWSVGTRLAARVGRVLERKRLALIHRLNASRLRTEATSVLRRPGARILCVCKGNIGRSPFAAAYMASRRPDLVVDSAGTLPLWNRMALEPVERLARRDHGLDLEGHRSQCVDREILEQADLIFAFDPDNLRALWGPLGELPAGRRPPVVLIGAALGLGPVIDPFRRSDEEVEGILRRIRRSLDAWLDTDGLEEEGLEADTAS